MAVTLLYAAQSTGSGYATITGNATFTLAGGETLVVMMNGFSTSDVGAPTDSNGTLIKQTAAYVAFSSSSLTHGGFYTEANAAAGSHTITPPVIAGGSDGMVAVWKLTNMPATLNIRASTKLQQVTASNSFTLTASTPSTPQAGDIAIGCRFHENSVPSTDVITPPSGWTSDFQYLNGAVNLPTDGSHFTVVSNGALAATWTDIDPAITDTSGAMLVLVPNPAASGTGLMGQGCC